MPDQMAAPLNNWIFHFFDLYTFTEICGLGCTSTPLTSITSFSLCVIRLKYCTLIADNTLSSMSAPEAPLGQVVLLHVLVLFCSALAVTPKLFAQ